MAVQQGTLAKTQAARFGVHLGTYIGGIVFNTAVRAPVRFAVRSLVGQQSGPRGYKREKFPEAQWQQILAGKRNWFD